MLRGILIAAAIAFLAVFTHRQTRLEQRVFKNVPLTDWITLLIAPIGLYIGWSIMINNIISRPYVARLPLDDFDIIATTFLFVVYAFVGNSLHFNSKVLWRYLRSQEHTMAYRVNEMFHGKLSHYLAYLCGLIVFFLLPILEINHPLSYPISSVYQYPIVIGGIVFGVCASKAIFYTNDWFGGYNKPLFIMVLFLIAILTSLFKAFQINFLFYPISLFITSIFASYLLTFIIRQAFIFTRLNSKKRLKFLARILSA